jgi:hypothetical protein
VGHAVDPAGDRRWLHAKRRKSAKTRFSTQLTFDPQELIELGRSFSATSGARLDVAAIDCDCEIGDERVFCFAGAM